MPQTFPSLFWRTPWLQPLNDSTAWNTVLQSLNATWSIDQVRARVLRVVPECANVFSLYLKPNRIFKGFKAGQHLALELELNGIRKARTFSISNASDSQGIVRLTIKINPTGTVSKAASRLKPGDVVGLSQATGRFTSESNPDKVLLISAGSGITPMMSLLQSWTVMTHRPDVVLVHTCRQDDELIFADELKTLVHRWPALQVHVHFSAANGHLDAERLSAMVPDLDSRQAYLCGPDALKTWVNDLYQQRDLSQNLKQEDYRQLRFTVQPEAARYTVHRTAGQPVFDAGNGQSLLEAAEQSGLKPAFGCRRGICMSCQCKKTRGIVRNQLTQTDSSDSEEWIQLCISTPLSDVHLEL